MFELADPTYFYLFGLIALLIVLYIINNVWKAKAREEFADAKLFRKLSQTRSTRKFGLKFILRLFLMAMVIIALVGPKIGTKLETVKREGVDIVFAIDVSKSMLAEDITPNRLEKGKQVVSSVIDNLVSDRVGVIVYAGKSYPQLPLTTDYSAAKMFLKAANTDIVPTQGTAIGHAVEMAEDYFRNSNKAGKVLFIISDGESHEEGFLEAAAAAGERGVIINTIGVGTTQGGPIPIKKNAKIVGYKEDRNGDVVVTKMDDLMLQQIANVGNGKFINGINTNNVVDFVKEQIASMEKSESETELFSDYEDQFQWFLGIAIFLLLIDQLIFERKTKWIQSLNLFGDEKAN